MQFIATGDAVVTRQFSPVGDPPVEQLRSLLQSADLAFTNLETAMPARPATPAAVPQGIHLAGGPFAIDELRWLGVGVVNFANNHVLDYSLDGLTTGLDQLEAANMPYAGAGRSLSEARAPVYVDTSAGRLALIGVCSSTADRSLASDAGAWSRARPGLNPLRFRTLYQVTEEQLRAIQDIDESLGSARARRSRVAASLSRARGSASYLSDGKESLEFAGRDFVVGDQARVLSSPHNADLDATRRAVASARRSADVVAVSIHCHEGAHDGWNSAEVPDFLVTAAHAWIETGADVVIGHGPHCLRPIEIYNGKPILYSLGNFIQTINTVAFVPPEAYEKQGLDPATGTIADYFGAYPGFDSSDKFWLSVIARLTFGETGAALELLPITLHRSKLHHHKGLPALPDESDGRAILTDLAKASSAYGTTIEIGERDGHAIGTVAIA